MKMVVGLGNPGPKYRHTRHNLGFMVLDRMAERLGVQFLKEKHEGLLAETRFTGVPLLMVKPLTYMNLSGSCVAALARNKIFSPADILVVVDDVSLPLGKVRVRADGSAGGHNGLKSIIERLGTQDFARVRMGVGENEAGGDLAEYVLAKFRPEEKPVAAEMVERAVDAALCWVAAGVEPAMNQFN